MSLKNLTLFVNEIEYDDDDHTQLFIDYATYFKNLTDYKIYKNYPKSVDSLFKDKYNLNNRELFKVFYFNLFSDKKELIRLVKDKVFIYPLVLILLKLDFEKLKDYINLFLSNLNTITSYSMFNINYSNKSFKIFLKDFYFKFINNVLEILEYLNTASLNANNNSLNNVSADMQISSYYQRYKDLFYVYIKDKELEKIEKKVLLQVSSPPLLSKY